MIRKLQRGVGGNEMACQAKRYFKSTHRGQTDLMHTKYAKSEQKKDQSICEPGDDFKRARGLNTYM